MLYLRSNANGSPVRIVATALGGLLVSTVYPIPSGSDRNRLLTYLDGERDRRGGNMLQYIIRWHLSRQPTFVGLLSLPRKLSLNEADGEPFRTTNR